MTDYGDAFNCFLCLKLLRDGREIVVVGPMNIPVHQDCFDKGFGGVG